MAAARQLKTGRSCALSIRDVPGGLASHTSGSFWQRREAFVSNLSPAILANAVRTLSHAIARMLGLLPLQFEDVFDGLGIRTLALNLREIGSPESLAH